MGIFALLALMSIGMLATVIMDDTDEDPVEEELGPRETDMTLAYTGDDVITGGEGNDTLIADEDSEYTDSTEVFLNGGNDYAEAVEPFYTTIHGGDGDDTLVSRNVTHALHGDDGNDTLEGYVATTLHGGDGDDHLTVDWTDDLNDQTTRLYGDAGDDIFNLTTEIGHIDYGVGAFVTSGGEGSDVFNVTIRLVPETDYPFEEPDDDAGPVDAGTILTLSDFDENEDVLTIDIDRTSGNEDREMLAAEITRTETGSVLTMRFAASDTASESMGHITFVGNTTITLDDITFLHTEIEAEIAGQTLAYTGDYVIAGGEGNDSLVADEDSEYADTTEVFLKGGDDHGETGTGSFQTTLHGGEGDDNLVSTQVGNVLYGDEGDDTLSGVVANRLYGGEGDDQIIVDQTVDLNDQTTLAFGGAGNDSFDLTAEIGRDDLQVGGLVVSGGEGSDVFNVTLRLEAGTDHPLGAGTDPDITDSGSVLTLADFDQAEDIITIEIDRTAGNEDREMLSAEIITHTDSSELVMRFAASDSALESVSSITFAGNTTITLDNIAFVEAGSPAVQADPSAEADPDTTPRDLHYSGTHVISGSDGDDTLGADADSTYAYTTEVFLKGGDDTAEVADHLVGATVHGGDGDDALVSTNTATVLYGEDGNDTLEGINADRLYGGQGDDSLVLDNTVEWNTAEALASGGDGNDSFDLTAEIGRENTGGGMVAIGGEGSDVFDVTLQLVTGTESSSTETPSIIDSGIVLSLQDFDPDEDMLTIEIERTVGNEHRDMLSAEIVTADSGSELIMHFAASDSALETVSSIVFAGSSAITMDDIAFVQA